MPRKMIVRIIHVYYYLLYHPIIVTDTLILNLGGAHF